MLLRKLLLIGICVFPLMSGGVSFAEGEDDKVRLDSSSFEIPVAIFTPGGQAITGGGSGTAVEDANFALGFIIQRLMLFIGAFALLVMTIGSGYMIIHRGDDALLSKGKEIFMAGILGLSIALLSYIMVSVVRFLLYNT